MKIFAAIAAALLFLPPTDSDAQAKPSASDATMNAFVDALLKK